jgi:FkbM family methyltransferase
MADSKLRTFLNMSAFLGYGQAGKLYLARVLGAASVDIRVPGAATTVACRTQDSDRHVLCQVFLERDCDVPLARPPKFIIDGGANVGYASVLLASKYPDAKILAIEPDAENCRIAEINCKPYKNVKVLKAAIWHSNVPVEIANPDADAWGFAVKEADKPTDHSVPGYTIDRLMEEAGVDVVDLLKLDIEGGEEALFSHPDIDWLDRVRVLVIEVHNEAAREAVLNAVKARNFETTQSGEKIVFRNRALG